MKQLVQSALLVLLIAAGIGCSKKDKDFDEGDINAPLLGTWELRKQEGNFTINYPAGNDTVLKLAASKYERYSNGQLVKSGSYSLVADDSCEETVGWLIAPGEFTQRIVFDNDISGDKEFLQVKGNKLTFLKGYFPLDGGTSSQYEKVAK